MKTSHMVFTVLAAVLIGGCSDSTTGIRNPGGAGGTGGGGAGRDGGGLADPLVVVTDKGMVGGKVVGATRAYLGIPYAQSPVGDLRWKPPRPADAWADMRDATTIGPACPQIDFVTSQPVAGTSEDCLTLNVWAPPPGAPAPTLFWIHGGGFGVGSGGDPAFDGRVLSEATGAIVVTINYRLGPLGFLAHSALAGEDPAYRSAGNYGFEDQRAALEWVQKNIAAFGGGSRNITIFGESAGGVSVCLHLVSPRSSGLFQRAILQSGPCSIGTGRTEKQAEELGDRLAGLLGCVDSDHVLACLRSKSAEEIVSAIKPTPTTLTGGGPGWYPNIDGLNIMDAPAKLLEGGAFSHVPTILGANKDEGTVFFLPGAPDIDEAGFLALMELYFPGQGAKIVAEYSSTIYGTLRDAAEEAFGDGLFVCPARFAAGAISRVGTSTFLYSFTREVTSAMFPGYGAFHSAEIPFIFGNPYWDLMLGAEDEELAKTMRGYWGRLAKTDDPNGDAAPFWPRYYEATEHHQVFDRPITTAQRLKGERCAFWKGISW